MGREIALHTYISLFRCFIISFFVSYLLHHLTDGLCLDPIFIHLPAFALLFPLLVTEARSTVLDIWGHVYRLSVELYPRTWPVLVATPLD